MKKTISVVLGIFFFHFFTAYLWAVPYDERKVIINKDSRFGGEDDAFTPPYFKQDEHKKFRYLRARGFNLVRHKFASPPDFRSSEEAARFFLSDHTYGPVLGLLNEAVEMHLLNIKNEYTSNSKSYRGRQFIRFQQYYKNIPIVAAEIIVQLTSKLELSSIIGRVVPGMAYKDISIDPVVSSQDATNTSLLRLGAKFGVASDQIDVISTQKSIFNQYIFDGKESICALVWQIELEINDHVEIVLVDAKLSDTVIMELPVHPEERLFYAGQTGAICNTFEMIADDIEDTPANMPQTITDVTYSCNDEKRDGIFVNSGVGNKAAFLMAHGGTIQDGSQKIEFTGIGEALTQDIFTEAKNMLPIAADFYDFHYALLQASKNLGINNLDTDHVKKAVDFVSMNSVPCQFDQIPGINDKPQCDFGCGVKLLFEDHFDSDDSPANWIRGSNSGTPFWYVPQTSSDIGFNHSFANSGSGNAWAFAQKGASDTWLAMNQDIGPLPVNSFLFFAHAFIFDASDSSEHHNGGLIEYSTNGGASWTDCSLLTFKKNGYNGGISSNNVNPLKGRNAFVGKSNGYMATIIDLTSLENQSVRFRFRMGSGADLSYYGWFIDDFQIYTCDIFSQIPEICQNPTVRSNGSGNWNQSGSWSTGRIPGLNDIVRVDHGMTINLGQVKLKALCNYGHLKSDNIDINIQASSFIHNEGKIWAADGANGKWQGNRFENGGDGRHVILNSPVIQNAEGGNIQAGRGGHALAADFSHALLQVSPKGGNGGNIVCDAHYIKNKGSMGPASLSYSTDAFYYTEYKPHSLVNTIMPNGNTDGGNGGICCNGYKDYNFGGNNVHRGYVSNHGDAVGGNGGHIILSAKFSIEHSAPGIIAAGNGAPSRVAGAYGNRIPGDAGNVYYNAPFTEINGDIYFDHHVYLDASRKGGTLFWDPIMTINGSATKISGAQNIVISGGEDWDFIVGDSLTQGAFSAKNIHIALGESGMLNMQNAPADIFKASEKVVISVDHNNIPVEGSRTRANLVKMLKRKIDAPLIEIQSSEIRYEFDFNIEAQNPQQRNRKNVRSRKGETTVFDITLKNNGANSDTYSIKLEPSNGVVVSDVQHFVPVEGLSSLAFPLEVTLPDMVSNDYKVDVVIESRSSLNNTKIQTIELAVEPTIAYFSYKYDKAKPGFVSYTAEPIFLTLTIASYEWNLGDGSPIKNEKVIRHTYSEDGTYKVILTVTDSDGNSEKIQRFVTVKRSKILLLAADEIRETATALASTGLFKLENIDTREMPNLIRLEDLMPYNAVLVWSKYGFTSSDNVGNVLKQYVDNGGGVVLASYCYFKDDSQTSGLQINNLQISGGILKNGYSPFLPSGQSSVSGFIRVSDLKNPDHFLFSGIQEIDAGQNPSYNIDDNKGSNPQRQEDFIPLAYDTLGNRVVATNELGSVVAVNMYPEDMTSPGAKRLMANALLYVTGKTGNLRVSTKEVNVRATSGTVEIDVINTGNGNMFWKATTDAHWIQIESGASGTDDGTIKFRYDAYNAPDEFRVGEILVSALGALNSPIKIMVTQGENEAPVISSISDQSLLEDQEISITFTVFDHETRASDLLVSAYADNTDLIPDTGISFNNPGTDRILIIKPDENKFGTATITVSVSDHSHVVSRSFQVIVNAVNDAPEFLTGDNIVLTRGQHYDLLEYADWPAMMQTGPSNENNQQLTFHTIVENEVTQYFDQIPSISSEGILTFNPKDNFYNNTVTIGVYASDNGGTANDGIDQSVVQYFTIFYGDDLPTFKKGSSIFRNEDCGVITVSEWATDIDSGTDTQNPNLSFLIKHITNESLFDDQPSVDINGTNGTLRFSSRPNLNGVAFVTVVLKDNDRNVESEPSRFMILIAPVNDPPSFSASNVSSVEDDLPQSFEKWADINPGPYEERFQSVRFEVTNCTNLSLFSKQPQVSPDGRLTYTSAPDQTGTAVISVLIRDNGRENQGGSHLDYQIDVLPKNDAPSFTPGNKIFEYDEDDGCRTIENWASNISKGPSDEDSQAISFEVSTDNPNLFEPQPSVNSFGDLTFCFASNRFGIANVYVTINDNGGIYYGGEDIGNTEKIALRVREVNDCPSFVKGGNQSNAANAGYISTQWASDISAGPNELYQDISFTAETDNYTLFQYLPQISATGILSYETKPHINGTATVSVRLSDNGSLNGSACSESALVSFNIESIEAVQTVNVTINAIGNGTIQWNGVAKELPFQTSVIAGSLAELLAIPDDGWTFDAWNGILNQQNPIALTIDQSMVIDARFEKNLDVYSISLNAGWNLFSCPVLPESDALTAVFPSYLEHAWYYDVDAGAYEPAAHIKPGFGYWIKMSKAVTFEIKGTPGIINPPIKPGWHLLGSAYCLLQQNIISEDTHVFIYRDQAYHDVLIQNVSDGNGFWIKIE
jgi:hypothetical protein